MQPWPTKSVQPVRIIVGQVLYKGYCSEQVIFSVTCQSNGLQCFFHQIAGKTFSPHNHSIIAGCHQDYGVASLLIGQTLQPAISPKQNMNRSLIIRGSWSSGIGTKPNVL